MRHLKSKKTLNRKASHRRALLMNLSNALFKHESIKTTNPKAMELKGVADNLITLAKRKDMHAMRLAFAFLRDKEIVRKLFTDIGNRYADISGGYTRVLKLGRRKGDNAPMALIELTMKKEEKKKEEKVVEKKKKEPKKAEEKKVVKEKEKKPEEKAPKEKPKKEKVKKETGKKEKEEKKKAEKEIKKKEKAKKEETKKGQKKKEEKRKETKKK